MARQFQQNQGNMLNKQDLKKETNKYLRTAVPQLHKDKNDARMILGGVAGTAAVGAYKYNKHKQEQEVLDSYTY